MRIFSNQQCQLRYAIPIRLATIRKKKAGWYGVWLGCGEGDLSGAVSGVAMTLETKY